MRRLSLRYWIISRKINFTGLLSLIFANELRSDFFQKFSNFSTFQSYTHNVPWTNLPRSYSVSTPYLAACYRLAWTYPARIFNEPWTYLQRIFNVPCGLLDNWQCIMDNWQFLFLKRFFQFSLKKLSIVHCQQSIHNFQISTF